MKDYAPLYHFLARAFLQPPDTELLELAADIPELSPHLKDDLEDHYSWLFDFNVYPYASIFLDPSGMLNAPWSGFVGGVYRALGLEVTIDAALAAPDHLGAELEAVAVLLETELTGDLELERLRHAQRVLLNEHLLPWLPAFADATARIDNGFYAALANLVLDLALEHAAELTEAPATPFVFQETPRQAGDGTKSGGAREQLQTLITPARSGLFLSRADITVLGRRLDLPVRFAERAYMLEQLVASATDAACLGDLFTLWAEAGAAQRGRHTHLSDDYPLLAPLWQDWIESATRSEAYLLELAQEAKTAPLLEK